MRTIYYKINWNHQTKAPIIFRKGEAGVRVQFDVDPFDVSASPDVSLFVEDIEAVGATVGEYMCYVDIVSEMTENIGVYAGHLIITDGSYRIISHALQIEVQEVA
jgi:hypothetical protein